MPTCGLPSSALQYRKIVSSYELIKMQRSQREAFAEQLKARFQGFLAGQQGATLDKLLESQRFWAQALQAEYAAIRDYNNAIVTFEAAKGTNLTRNNIIINEAMLPVKAQKQAAEHLDQRKHALPIRERAIPEIAPVPIQDAPPTLEVNNAPDKGQTLVNLWQKDPPLRESPSLPPLYAVSGPSSIQQMDSVGSEILTRPVVPVSATGPAPIATSGAARVGPPSPASSPSPSGSLGAPPMQGPLTAGPGSLPPSMLPPPPGTPSSGPLR